MTRTFHLIVIALSLLVACSKDSEEPLPTLVAPEPASEAQPSWQKDYYEVRAITQEDVEQLGEELTTPYETCVMEDEDGTCTETSFESYLPPGTVLTMADVARWYNNLGSCNCRWGSRYTASVECISPDVHDERTLMRCAREVTEAPAGYIDCDGAIEHDGRWYRVEFKTLASQPGACPHSPY